jgi:thymidylate synthase ThyX
MARYDHFQFSISDPDETDLVLVSVTDTRTGFTVRTALPNNGKQTASIMAFAGARYSRSALSAQDLFKEIKQSGKDANEKLATIFRNYGHASVADMAMLFAYVENIPELYASTFFYETSIGGGQQRSTRYQDFSKSEPVPLSYYIADNGQKDYQAVSNNFYKLQDDALNYYRKYIDILEKKYTDVYEIDATDKRQTGALTARVFDSARAFLPHGTCLKTSLAWVTSAREWARIISRFKSFQDPHMNYLAEQLEVLFAPDEEVAEELGYTPEAPDLIRYTTGDETTSTNLKELKAFLEEKTDFVKTAKFHTTLKFHPVDVLLIDDSTGAGTKVAMQNIMSIYPTVDIEWLALWLHSLDNEVQAEMSRIIYHGFNHHKQMGAQFRVNTHSFMLTCSIAETRDLDRHRAWGRFIPMLSAEYNFTSLYNEGYTLPAYLYENPKLAEVRVQFEEDLKAYYKELKSFINDAEKSGWFPQYLILQLLPFAHLMRMWMHGSPKEISYMTKLRVRPGGHINYRMLAYRIAEVAANSVPFLAGIAIPETDKPDPSSRAEFIDRS